MVSALVLLNTNIGEENQTYEKLKAINGVQEVHALWGVYDFLVRVNSASIEELNHLVHSQLRLAGANSRLTLMMVKQPP